MFLHYVLFVLLLFAAHKTRPDNASFRAFLQSLAAASPPSAREQPPSGFFAAVSSFFSSAAPNLPEFKTQDCLLFTLHELDDGRTYLGIFGLFFHVHTRNGPGTDPEQGRATVDAVAEGMAARAAKAKAASDFAGAARAHLDAAALLRSNGMAHGAGENFEAACKALQHVKDMGRAREALLRAAECFREDARTAARAGRHFENLAQMERKEGILPEAVEHLGEALRCFEEAGDARAAGVSLALADLTAESGSFAGAASRLEACAERIADDAGLSYRLPDVLLDLCLCALAQGDPVAMSRKREGLAARYPRFEAGSAGVAARDLCAALDARDVDALESCMRRNAALLGVWRTAVLQKQIKEIESESIT
ncbi:soluble NSF attachment protein [Hyaloraphidium curvatum]|nr:soluble NSF attachment protein [Hyaloraphidium curvatum]